MNEVGENLKIEEMIYEVRGKQVMLATVLHTSVVAEISITIMRVFFAVWKIINSNLTEQKYINDLVLKDNKRIDLLEETFSKFESNEKNHYLFFEGQIFDAYSLLINIINKAKKEIIVIDNYVDTKLLDVLSKTKKSVCVYTKNIDKNALEKYKMQYENVKIEIRENIHERFIILDRKVLYHCGASFKDLRKKCFWINKIEDKYYLKELL